MPSLAQLFIRTALFHLGIGVTLGGVILWNKGAPIAVAVWRWLPAHISLVTWGWLLNLTFGVAFWILPRFRGSRGKVWLAWTAYVSLNGAVLAAGLAPWLPGPWPTAGAGLLQLAAALAFAIHAWPRVKPAGR